MSQTEQQTLVAAYLAAQAGMPLPPANAWQRLCLGLHLRCQRLLAAMVSLRQRQQ